MPDGSQAVQQHQDEVASPTPALQPAAVDPLVDPLLLDPMPAQQPDMPKAFLSLSAALKPPSLPADATPDPPDAQKGVDDKLQTILEAQQPRRKKAFSDDLKSEATLIQRMRKVKVRQAAQTAADDELEDSRFVPEVERDWNGRYQGGFDNFKELATRDDLRHASRAEEVNARKHPHGNHYDYAKGVSADEVLEARKLIKREDLLGDEADEHGHWRMASTDASIQRGSDIEKNFRNAYGKATNFESDTAAVLAGIPPARLKRYRQLGLNDAELGAIVLYTTEWFGGMNGKLRNDTLNTAERRYMKLMKSGLAKLPKGKTKNHLPGGKKIDDSKGDHDVVSVDRVYRYFTDIDLFTQLYVPGATLTEKGFLSTSAGGPIKKGHPILVIDNAKEATPVMGLSHVPSENEMLFAPPTQLRVKAVRDERIGKNVKAGRANTDDYTDADYLPDADVGYDNGKSLVAHLEVVSGGDDKASAKPDASKLQGSDDPAAIAGAVDAEDPALDQQDPIAQAAAMQ
jgi:hypothetical protein